mgnify:CR=1 FL=1
MAKQKSNSSFEQKLKRLEEITELLESENTSLEESISLYEESVQLSKECISILEKAELKIKNLKNEMKELSIKDFNNNE